MEKLTLITKSLSGDVHSVLVSSNNRIKAIPVAKDSAAWVSWIDDSSATINDVKNCLSFDLQNEFALDVNTKSLTDLVNKTNFFVALSVLVSSTSDAFLERPTHFKTMGRRFLSRQVLTKSLDNISVKDYRFDEETFYPVHRIPLHFFDDLKNVANYKAFVARSDTASLAFGLQLKALRAYFDPDIGPGGGWRCPVGTINGGQITDRFGRGCGGRSRRLGRMLTELARPTATAIKPEARQTTPDASPRRRQRLQRGLSRAAQSDARRSERRINRGVDRARKRGRRQVDRAGVFNPRTGEVGRSPSVLPSEILMESFRQRRGEDFANNRRDANAESSRDANIALERRRINREVRRLSMRNQRLENYRSRRGLTRIQRDDLERVRVGRGREIGELRSRAASNLTSDERRRAGSAANRRNRSVAERRERRPVPVEEGMLAGITGVGLEREPLRPVPEFPWETDPRWVPSFFAEMTNRELQDFAESIEITTPFRYDRLDAVLQAQENGKLAMIEAARAEIMKRGSATKNPTFPTPKKIRDESDASLIEAIRFGKFAEKNYVETPLSDERRESLAFTIVQGLIADRVLRERNRSRQEELVGLRNRRREDQKNQELTNRQQSENKLRGYIDTLAKINNRQLVDEYFKTYAEPLEGNFDQEDLNKALLEELGARGVRGLSRDMLDKWADIDPGGDKDSSSGVSQDRVSTSRLRGSPQANDPFSHDFLDSQGLPTYAWWRDVPEEKLILDNKYGNFYNSDGLLNERGQYLNNLLRLEGDRRSLAQSREPGSQRETIPEYRKRELIDVANLTVVQTDEESKNGTDLPNELPLAQRRRRAKIVAATESSDDLPDEPPSSDENIRSIDDPVNQNIIRGENEDRIFDVFSNAENRVKRGVLRSDSGEAFDPYYDAASDAAKEVNEVADEVAHAIRQLDSYRAGQLEMSDEEVLALEDFILDAVTRFDTLLPPLAFSLDNSKSSAYSLPSGRILDLGLLHSQFSNSDRQQYIAGRLRGIAELTEPFVNFYTIFDLLSALASEIQYREGVRRPSRYANDPDSLVGSLLNSAGQYSVGPNYQDFLLREYLGLSLADFKRLEQVTTELINAVNAENDYANSYVRQRISNLPEVASTLRELALQQRRAILSILQIFAENEKNVFDLFATGANIFNFDFREIFNSIGQYGEGSVDALINSIRRAGDDDALRKRVLVEAIDVFDERLRAIADAYEYIASNIFKDGETSRSARLARLQQFKNGEYYNVVNTFLRTTNPNMSAEERNNISSAVSSVFSNFIGQDDFEFALDEAVHEVAARLNALSLGDVDAFGANARRQGESEQGLVSNFSNPVDARVYEVVNAAKNKRRRRLGMFLEKLHGSWSAKPWDTYAAKNGGHDITPSTLRDVATKFSRDDDVRYSVSEWFGEALEIGIDLPNGARVYSTVESVKTVSRSFIVEGTIKLRLPNGRQVDAGTFTRKFGDNPGRPQQIENHYLSIKDIDINTGLVRSASKMKPSPNFVSLRDSGFGSLFNQHAFNWWKSAGFTEVYVVAGLTDGPYVWGRLGFQYESSSKVKQLWNAVAQELNLFDRRGAGPGVIESSEQAEMLRLLVDQAKGNNYDPRNSPGMMEAMMVLEAGSTNSDRRKEVRKWFEWNDLMLDTGTLGLDESVSPVDPTPSRRPQIVGDGAVHEIDQLPLGLEDIPDNPTILSSKPHDLPKNLSTVSSPVQAAGDISHPVDISDPSVDSQQKAIDRLRETGSLDGIPNRFWPVALKENSSDDPQDMSTLFYSPKIDNGVGGWVEVYYARNLDGTISPDGWAIKYLQGTIIEPPEVLPRGFTLNTPPDLKNPDMKPSDYNVDLKIQNGPMLEVLGYNVAATLGLIPRGAAYAGVQLHSPEPRRPDDPKMSMYSNAVILPMHTSLLPEGLGLSDVTMGRVANYDADMLNTTEFRSLPERLAVAVHYWGLGVIDRHLNNTMSIVDENNRGYIFPIDYGIQKKFGYDINKPNSFWDYVSALNKWDAKAYHDSNLEKESVEFYNSLSFEERLEYRQRLEETIDRMLNGYSALVSRKFEAFKQMMLQGYESEYQKLLDESKTIDAVNPTMGSLSFDERMAINGTDGWAGYGTSNLQTVVEVEQISQVRKLEELFDRFSAIVDSRNEIKQNIISRMLGE